MLNYFYLLLSLINLCLFLCKADKMFSSFLCLFLCLQSDRNSLMLIRMNFDWIFICVTLLPAASINGTLISFTLKENPNTCTFNLIKRINLLWMKEQSQRFHTHINDTCELWTIYHMNNWAQISLLFCRGWNQSEWHVQFLGTMGSMSLLESP